MLAKFQFKNLIQTGRCPVFEPVDLNLFLIKLQKNSDLINYPKFKPVKTLHCSARYYPVFVLSSFTLLISTDHQAAVRSSV